MILDLSIFEEKTLDIKMANGQILRIPKPSQKMVIQIIRMRDVDEKTPEGDKIAAINRLVQSILNENLSRIIFNENAVDALPMDARLAIINAYTAFIQEIQSNPS